MILKRTIQGFLAVVVLPYLWVTFFQLGASGRLLAAALVLVPTMAAMMAVCHPYWRRPPKEPPPRQPRRPRQAGRGKRSESSPGRRSSSRSGMRK